MITLGMIGTVAGFLIMLNTAFSGLDVNDIRNVQEAISDMAIGMSTALVTTLVGLICSTLIKVQILVYENSTSGN
jgi:flagellar motor component MotA